MSLELRECWANPKSTPVDRFIIMFTTSEEAFFNDTRKPTKCCYVNLRQRIPKIEKTENFKNSEVRRTKENQFAILMYLDF